jgi:hypothetical protein
VIPCTAAGNDSKVLPLNRGEARLADDSGAGLKIRLLSISNGAVAGRSTLLLDNSSFSRCADCGILSPSEYAELEALGGNDSSRGTSFGGIIGHSSDVGVPVTWASTRVRFALGGLNGFTYCAMGGLGRGLSRLTGGLRVAFCG